MSGKEENPAIDALLKEAELKKLVEEIRQLRRPWWSQVRFWMSFIGILATVAFTYVQVHFGLIRDRIQELDQLETKADSLFNRFEQNIDTNSESLAVWTQRYRQEVTSEIGDLRLRLETMSRPVTIYTDGDFDRVFAEQIQLWLRAKGYDVEIVDAYEESMGTSLDPWVIASGLGGYYVVDFVNAIDKMGPQTLDSLQVVRTSRLGHSIQVFTYHNRVPSIEQSYYYVRVDSFWKPTEADRR